jgi:MGT family glycosyltransferase
MEDKKPKNILVVNGILHAHFTVSVEIVRDLVLLGHNVTCFVSHEFEDRIKVVGAKVISYSIDKVNFTPPPGSPMYAANAFLFTFSYDKILTFLSKEKDKYDYFMFDSFYDIKEMNKVLNIPLEKYILIYSSFVFVDNKDTFKISSDRVRFLKPINIKYNINLNDFVSTHYAPNKFKKLIVTSKYFHLRGENTDETCFFVGPSIEKRKVDENFKFKKDENKKLVYISLGTINNFMYDFFLKCIEAFKDSEEYQIIMSIGKSIDIKKLGDIPKNISIFTYVPQTQLLPDVDVFITHGGLSSTQEGLMAGVPLIVIPFVNDQFDNAKRVEELGAGISLDHDKITVDTLKNAVNNIIANIEHYKKGVDKIVESFKQSINNRKNIYEKIFV